MRRFEFSDSTSNKFWEVDVKGKTLNVTFGKIGTKGQGKPKDFATPEKAKAEMEKLIKEKTGKGYLEVGGKALKATKPPAKPAAGKQTNAGSMAEGLSKAEKKAKAEKVLLMFAGGQWELARGILEAAQDEHWLFQELLKGCKIEDGAPTPSMFMKKIFDEDYYDNMLLEDPEFDGDPDNYLPINSELAMLEVLANLSRNLKRLPKFWKKFQIHPSVLSRYWKKVVDGTFEGFEYAPKNFSDLWLAERDAEIAKIEKKCEATGNALKKPWMLKEDLGNGLKLEMILIPPGIFMMGSPRSEKSRDDNETQHKVTLTKPYYMSSFVVTRGHWKAVMGNYPCNTESYSDYHKSAKLPVDYLSWYNCQEFIQKLNVVTKGGYRLPTEAEWEYACRAGTKTAYSFGDEITPFDANYSHSKIGLMGNGGFPKGKYKPNAFRLYNMHGNVMEWCEDWYGDYPRGPLTDPKGPKKGEWRVLRGGHVYNYADRVRSSYRLMENPSEESGGFRLARTI